MLTYDIFQDDIGSLYQSLQKLRRSRAALALAPEQTNTYMRAFAGWQRLNPSTKLGRPPPGECDQQCDQKRRFGDVFGYIWSQ